MRIPVCDSCERVIQEEGEDRAYVINWYGNLPDELSAGAVGYQHNVELCGECARRITQAMAEALLLEVTPLYGITEVDESTVRQMMRGELQRRGARHDDFIPF